jgi:hypothetical protein
VAASNLTRPRLNPTQYISADRILLRLIDHADGCMACSEFLNTADADARPCLRGRQLLLYVAAVSDANVFIRNHEGNPTPLEEVEVANA